MTSLNVLQNIEHRFAYSQGSKLTLARGKLKSPRQVVFRLYLPEGQADKIQRTEQHQTRLFRHGFRFAFVAVE